MPRAIFKSALSDKVTNCTVLSTGVFTALVIPSTAEQTGSVCTTPHTYKSATLRRERRLRDVLCFKRRSLSPRSNMSTLAGGDWPLDDDLVFVPRMAGGRRVTAGGWKSIKRITNISEAIQSHNHRLKHTRDLWKVNDSVSS